MKKHLLILTIALLLGFSAACQPTVQTSETSGTEDTTVVLEFLASDGTTTSLTLQDVQALPVTEGQAGIKSSTGKITLPTAFKGVSLKNLISADPAFDSSMGITLYAVDGYSITFSYDQVMSGGDTFIQYDPGSGDELKSPLPATAILAYEMNGEKLNAQNDGYLRLVVVSDEPMQVVDGHWSVKFVNKIEVKPLSEDWILELEGAIDESMDRATFESGSSENCHGVTWVDENGQDWTGIALWRLVGRVDDAVKHEGPAFNDAAANAGYQIEIVAKDGYSITLDIATIKRVDTILVAYQVDGAALPDKYFPLRLVGEGLEKDQMIGAIAKIIVNVDPITETAVPTIEPTMAAAESGAADSDLSVAGLVTTPLSLFESDLRAMEVVTLSAEHPKKGLTEYEGVRLNTLLEATGIKSNASKLVLTADDGYSVEVFLSEVEACPDCLLAFSDTPGVFSLVMPGMTSTYWMKGIVSIDIQ